MGEPSTEANGSLPVFKVRRSLEDDGPADQKRLQEAVSRAKQGDTAAIHHIYERYADNVFSYVRSIVRDDHTAEDVTQHVFTKLLTKIGRYEERSVPFTAWLLRIARNCAIDHVRGDRTVCYEEVPTTDRVNHHEVSADRRHALQDALGCLPEGQRRVVVMRHIFGLSPGEIAVEMGKSEGAVHTLHHRARRALQGELRRRDTMPVCMARESVAA
jgi:RNA polymerase sigma-70 factor (ECF subfamily)